MIIEDIINDDFYVDDGLGNDHIPKHFFRINFSKKLKNKKEKKRERPSHLFIDFINVNKDDVN